jgi:exonuclease SbcC
MEIKRQILRILRFNEDPNPRTGSKIYRYGVFTPQEEVKAILDPKFDRLETLRRAFKVEEYSTALGNNGDLASHLRGEVRELKGKVAGMEENRTKLREKETEVQSLTEELSELRSKRSSLGQEHTARVKELGRLREEKEKIQQIKSEIDNLEKLIESAKENVKSEQPILKRKRQEATELGEEIALLEKLERPTELSEEQLRGKCDGLAQTISAKRDVLSRAQGKLEDFQRLVDEGICPTCEREVQEAEAGQFHQKIENKQTETGQLKGEVEVLETEEQEAEKLCDNLTQFLRQQATLAEKREQLGTLSQEIGEIESKVNGWKTGKTEYETQLETKRTALEKHQDLDRQIEDLEKRVGELAAEKEEVAEAIGGKESAVESVKSEVADLRAKIETQEKDDARRRAFEKLENWLDQHLKPAVEKVEEAVLSVIHEEFDATFRRWFDRLVESDELTARVDKDFNLIIEQGGYLQSLNTLSGGEKTAVALAYRLALNHMVNKINRAKHRLLILDEPTDGFSKDQLFSLRELLLYEVGCDQVLVVSHEKEVEAFADYVYEVAKVRGQSSVETPF